MPSSWLNSMHSFRPPTNPIEIDVESVSVLKAKKVGAAMNGGRGHIIHRVPPRLLVFPRKYPSQKYLFIQSVYFRYLVCGKFGIFIPIYAECFDFAFKSANWRKNKEAYMHWEFLLLTQFFDNLKCVPVISGNTIYRWCNFPLVLINWPLLNGIQCCKPEI